jgi:hypothetical protein
MEAPRYTLEQILDGLAVVWAEVIPKGPAVRGDLRIDHQLKVGGGWEEIDLMDVFFRVQRFFGFRCADAEWRQLFRTDLAREAPAAWEETAGSFFTFGHLARFIADRLATDPSSKETAFAKLLSRRAHELFKARTHSDEVSDASHG